MSALPQAAAAVPELPLAGKPAAAVSHDIPSLDGIRAVAVGLVYLSHMGLEHVVPGDFGVSLFFVLSGFLITTLLRGEYRRSGTLALPAFYLRRILRLGPPLLLVIAGALLLQWLGLVHGGTSAGGVLAAVLYFGNYFIALFGYDSLPPGLGVIWSLAVEEHYYLIYPALALWLLRRGSARLTALVLGGACVVILLWRVVLVAWLGMGDGHYIKIASDTRMDAILFGCLLGFLRNPWIDPALPRRPRSERLVIGGCVAVLLFCFAWRDQAFRETFRYTLQYAALLPLYYLCVARHREWPFSWLNARPVRYLGSVSYVVYLTNQLLIYVLHEQLPRLPLPAIGLLALPLVLLVAELIRRYVEVPLGRLRRQLHGARAGHGTSPAAAGAGLLPMAEGR